MSPRNTQTGAVLENMVLPALKSGGYSYEAQVYVGMRLGGGRHRVDVLVTDSDEQQILVSLKWQQVSGTADQKVPFEVLCLIEAVRASPIYKTAYLVLGGEGWKLRNFYINELENYLKHKEYVTILTLEGFVAKANRGRL